MSELSFRSAGVSVRTIDQTRPTGIQPVGIPAGSIGTSVKGPAFVPTTVATIQDLVVTFGAPENDRANGILAAAEWLQNQQSATYLRVLGAGEGLARESLGDNAGRVKGAGFVVGAKQPQKSLGGDIGDNPHANAGGVEGRLHFLGAFMSQSVDSTIFSEAGRPEEGVPVIQGVLMSANGVAINLSASIAGVDNDILPTDVAGIDVKGGPLGSVRLDGGRQEFVLLLNGHKGDNPLYPNVITASFDVSSPNYFPNVMNTDPLLLEEAGYVLYTHYGIHSGLATVTGSGVVDPALGANVPGNNGIEPAAFILTGSADWNKGTATAPSFENFEDRYQAPRSPWVTSQKFGGKVHNLFRVHSLDDGTWANNRIKISIENIVPGNNSTNPYTTFDLIVRDIVDTDKNKIVLEGFRGVSLNPYSDRYIAKVIGDTNTFYNFDANEGRQRLVEEGDYPNRSRFIRVEMDPVVSAGELDPTAAPMGFRGPDHLAVEGTDPLIDAYDATVLTDANVFSRVTEMPIPYRRSINVGTFPNLAPDRGLYWGVQFTRQTSALEPNSSTVPESSIVSFAKYFPNFQRDWMNVRVGEEFIGHPDTVENGILDPDRYNNNGFTLENIELTINTASGFPDTLTLGAWRYVRDGGIVPTANTRALRVSDLADPGVRQVAKFTFFLQGGFDGVRIFDKDSEYLTNQAIVEEMDNVSRGITQGPTVRAYTKALEVMGDALDVDIQILTTPGIRHSVITDLGLQTVENRFDAIYLMDIEEYDGTNNLIINEEQIPSIRFTSGRFAQRGIDSSYGAAYYPDVIYRDNISGQIRTVPPSVAVLGAFARNDSIGHPWFAPAGFTRGALANVDEAAVKLSRENLDTLQDANINPIVAFAESDGTVIWGQKTLFQNESSLERINVRRLLISIRRQIRPIADRILFEPNREQTLARFQQLVSPILKRIQDQKGLDRFLVKIDASTTTQADIENNTIRGKIWVQPTRTLEYVSIDFVITNNSTFNMG